MCVACFFSFSFSFLLIYIDPPRSLEEPSKNFWTTRRDYVSHLRHASFSSFYLLTSGDDRTAGIASTTNARKTHKLSEHHFYFSFPFLLLSCFLYFISILWLLPIVEISRRFCTRYYGRSRQRTMYMAVVSRPFDRCVDRTVASRRPPAEERNAKTRRVDSFALPVPCLRT